MRTRHLRSRLPAVFGAAILALLLLFPATSRAQTTVTQITETDIFGTGTGFPATTDTALGIAGSVNGTAGTMNATQSAFSLNKIVIPGDAGSVTISYTISERVLLPADTTYTQTITFTVSTVTGAVTATGTDNSNGVVFGTTATLSVDGVTSAVDATSGSFTATATGTILDRSLRACVTFTSGALVCADVYLLSKAVVPPPVVLDDPKDWPNAQPNGVAGVPNGNGGTGTLTGANYSEAIQMFADQMANIMIYQLPIIGEMLDAKHQLETQRIFGAVAAQAFREYHPSEQVCAFGTLVRSTGPSQFKRDDNVSILNTLLQKRETLNANQASAWGPSADQNMRLDKYKAVYCDPNDNAGELGQAIPPLPAVCQNNGFNIRKNKDIDWQRTIEAPMTMDVDFTDTASTPDEEDVISLAKNLYASDIITAIPETAIAPYGTYRELQDSRMLTAIRSVERYSYASIVAAKARGTGLNAVQLQQVLLNLGVPQADVVTLVGANPSYFTQMDFMTQKMFQDPQFYTNLYSSPANVARMKVVLQSIRLMADRDRFEQSLRREMLISLLLEMKIRESQESTQNVTNEVQAIPR